jgi:MFS family permease
VQLVLMLLAALGALLFACGHSFAQLMLARAVIGCGLGGCFMSAVKALATWVAPKRLPSVQGYLIAVGGLGAASSHAAGARAAAAHRLARPVPAVGLLSACTGILIWFVTPRSKGRRRAAADRALGARRLPGAAIPRRDDLAGAGAACGLLRHPGPVDRALAVRRRPLSDGAVAYLLYLGMASVIFGAIAVGMMAEWAGRRGIAALDVAAAGVALFVLVQAAIVIGWKPSLQLLSVLFTLVGTITGIEYAIVAQSLPRALTGRAATCLNLLIFIGAFLVQAGFGQVLGLWPADGGGHYPVPAYRVAFGVLVALQLPGLVHYFLRRRPVQCGLLCSSRRKIMRLVRYGRPGKEKPGLFDEEGRLRDLSGVVADIDGDVLSEKSLRKLAKVDWKTLPLVRGNPRLGVPVKGVGKFIGIGMNYADHAAETGAPIPKEPIMFMKATSCLSGPDDPVSCRRARRRPTGKSSWASSSAPARST